MQLRLPPRDTVLKTVSRGERPIFPKAPSWRTIVVHIIEQDVIRQQIKTGQPRPTCSGDASVHFTRRRRLRQPSKHDL